MRHKIKDMYINGKSIDSICDELKIDKATIHKYKSLDAKSGICWDEILLARNTDASSIAEKEALFLNTLIKEFERELEDAVEREDLFNDTGRRHNKGVDLDKLSKYVKAYYMIKAPKRTNDKLISYETATATIKTIADIAISKGEKEVHLFLSSNANEIIERVFKRIKPYK